MSATSKETFIYRIAYKDMIIVNLDLHNLTFSVEEMT